LELSRDYAASHGLDLAGGAELEDIGISAFKGANVSEGALGRFLDAVRSGTVKPGSYLLVESLDRITRQNLLQAQALFLSIIGAGINVVTLADNKLYRAGTNDLGDLVLSLAILSRSHEESLTKSHRLSKKWKEKRVQAAALVPMTKWCPAWLRLDDDRARFVPIPERVEVVRKIFEDAASGLGMYAITRRLNEEGVPTFKSSKGWYTSYVAKILNNRAAIGESQAHTRAEDGKRVPAGEPNRAYFPAVISEELFYRAQLGKSERRLNGAGRKGTNFTNLFSGLATCAYCGSPVRLENKGDGPKGGKYLMCDGALRNVGCPSRRWRYQEFEDSFIAFVEEVDLESLVTEASEQSGARLEAEINALRGELVAANEMMERTYAVLSGGGPVDFVTSKLREQDARRTELSQRLSSKEKELESAASRREQMQRSKEELRSLIERLRDTSDDQLFKLRARVSAHMKTLINSLTLASVGERPLTKAKMEKLHQLVENHHGDVVSHVEAVSDSREQDRRYFSVAFRDGKVRIAFPDDRDALRYREQITADPVWGIQTVTEE
jgi:hypothetical protein